jgi:hypothetical protein
MQTKRITERVIRLEKMPAEEMWKRTLGPYVCLYGKSIEYIEERFGHDEAVAWVRRMEQDYREEHEALELRLANILERFTPGKGLRDKVTMRIFAEKVARTFYQYQFLYNCTDYVAKEFLDESGRLIGGKLEFQQCPYAAAMQAIPKKVRPKRETFCRYDCQGTFHDEFCRFIGFRIRMEPGRTGCVWNITPPKEVMPES